MTICNGQRRLLHESTKKPVSIVEAENSSSFHENLLNIYMQNKIIGSENQHFLKSDYTKYELQETIYKKTIFRSNNNLYCAKIKK